MRLLLSLLVAALAMPAWATGSHAKTGYIKKDGTYVAPSRATNPNDTKRDNYSSKGNVNPASGNVGTKDPGALPAYGAPKKK